MHDLNNEKIVTLNLRYLAYTRNFDRNHWLFEIDALLQGRYDNYRIQRLLEGSSPTDRELSLIADASGVSTQAIRSTKLFDRKNDLMCQNLVYLRSLIPADELKLAVKHVGVQLNNFSRWGKTVRKPRAKHLEKLLNYLYIDPELDLDNYPLFLSLKPLQSINKMWIIDQIESMSIRDIDTALPEFKRIFEAKKSTETA